MHKLLKYIAAILLFCAPAQAEIKYSVREVVFSYDDSKGVFEKSPGVIRGAIIAFHYGLDAFDTETLTKCNGGGIVIYSAPLLKFPKEQELLQAIKAVAAEDGTILSLNTCLSNRYKQHQLQLIEKEDRVFDEESTPLP